MAMRDLPLVPPVLVTFIAAIAAAAWIPTVAAASEPETPREVTAVPFVTEYLPHCAGSSLSILGRLLGHEWKESEVYTAFPTRSRTPSVKEVLTAARKLGLNLKARRVDLDAALTLRKPAIALIPATSPTEPGHYIVIRPLAKRPGVWQVIDPRATPLITTCEAVIGEGELVVLVPTRSGISRTVLFSGLGLVALAILVAWHRLASHLAQSRRSQPSADQTT